MPELKFTDKKIAEVVETLSLGETDRFWIEGELQYTQTLHQDQAKKEVYSLLLASNFSIDELRKVLGKNFFEKYAKLHSKINKVLDIIQKDNLIGSNIFVDSSGYRQLSNDSWMILLLQNYDLTNNTSSDEITKMILEIVKKYGSYLKDITEIRSPLKSIKKKPNVYIEGGNKYLIPD